MIKCMKNGWDQHKNDLYDFLNSQDDDYLNGLDYEELAKIVFDKIYNPTQEQEYFKVNLKRIHVIDDGDYQGTTIFVLPFDTYQPSEGDYLMTNIGYGSCSGCDALQAAQSNEHNVMVQDLMAICKDIVTATIRPYNCGWRKTDDYDEVVMD